MLAVCDSDVMWRNWVKAKEIVWALKYHIFIIAIVVLLYKS